MARAMLLSLLMAMAALPAEKHPLTLVAGSRLMLRASVNGIVVDALLDSAAETTILDRDFAKTLKLSAGRTVQGHGSGAEGFDASLIDGVTLGAVGLTLPNQTVAVVDLSDVGQRLLHRRIPMILGREIFDAARLSIDIHARTIAVVSKRGEPPGVRLSLVSDHGVETLPVKVDGRAETRATFDIGNGSRVLISNAFAGRMKLLGGDRPVRRERGGGLGGELSRQLVTLRELEIAGRTFKDVVAAVDPQASAADVNVGVSILRHFRITTDFAEHAVWLDPR